MSSNLKLISDPDMTRELIDQPPQNQSLLEEVIHLTGLPKERLRNEMMVALAELEQNPETLDLENLRALVAHYVQDVLVELKDEVEREC